MTTEPRSMTDTRTPDARLRELVADIEGMKACAPDGDYIRWDVDHADPSLHYVNRQGVITRLRAALGDADTPEPGLDERLRFLSWDGETEASMGQGDHCVLVQITGPGQHAGIVFSDDEAEAFGRSLIRRAEYARLATHPVEAPDEPQED